MEGTQEIKKWSDLSKEEHRAWLGGFQTALQFHAHMNEEQARRITRRWVDILGVGGEVEIEGGDDATE